MQHLPSNFERANEIVAGEEDQLTKSLDWMSVLRTTKETQS